MLDGGYVSENEIFEGIAGRWRIAFDESDVEVGVNINDASLQLDTVG